MSYNRLVSNRDVFVDGIGNWTWPTADSGGFDGPKEDWPEYKEAILKLTGDRRGVVVQAGGCCGMFPRLLMDHFSTIITFEPDPLNFWCLSQNCPSDSVYKFNAALSDAPGWALLERNHSNVGSNTLKATPGGDAFTLCTVPAGFIKVLKVRLDDLNLDRMDALLLDVEQHEGEVLAGAVETIERCRPALISVETNDDKVWRMMKRLGYVEHSKTVRDTYYVRTGYR